jgi:hypothetical protein
MARIYWYIYKSLEAAVRLTLPIIKFTLKFNYPAGIIIIIIIIIKITVSVPQSFFIRNAQHF